MTRDETSAPYLPAYETGVKIFTEMATFADAGVAEKNEEPVKRGA
jgi:hypothetical protein